MSPGGGQVDFHGCSLSLLDILIRRVRMLMKIEVLNLRKNEGFFVGAGQALGVHQQPRFAAQSARVDE